MHSRRRLVIGLVSGLALGLFNGLVYGLSAQMRFGPRAGIATGVSAAVTGSQLGGLVIGLLVGMYAGGEACLKHMVLRLWLIRTGSSPWNYVGFLKFAADRILLRQVGGGYVFLHRMLLDHFAARYVVPASQTIPTAKPSSI